ncbi:MAG: ABC transporter permease [Thermaerobacter sp.]|nr:ABC transporter permease [Thermaerobacter sp.]
MALPIAPTPVEEIKEAPLTSEGLRAWRHFRRNRGAVVALWVLVVVILAAILAPLLSHQSPVAQNLSQALQPPSPAHLLGTDEYGRDEFARVLFGARTALETGLIIVAISLSIGTLWGLLTAYYGGIWDMVLMRVADIFMAFPFLLLALMIVAALGPGLVQAEIAIAITYLPVYARLVRSVGLGIKQLEFVQAAKSLGARDALIIRRHFLPNLLPTLLVQATLNVGTAIIDVAGLSFLGMGVQPPTADWGAMLSDGQNFILLSPWLVLAPGIAILIVVLASNLVGDGLREALDPRSRHQA